MTAIIPFDIVHCLYQIQKKWTETRPFGESRILPVVRTRSERDGEGRTYECLTRTGHFRRSKTSSRTNFDYEGKKRGRTRVGRSYL